MDKLIFLDTETTGIDLLNDRLFQICFSYLNNISSEYFLPDLPISVKSQSITHVTNKMIAGKDKFTNSKMQKELQKLLKENILVAHNAVFDVYMLSKEGVEVPQFICTLKIARFLDTEGEIPEYNLQFLRYYFELEVEAEAHSAKGDVLVLEALFKKLYAKMLEIHKDPETVIGKMIEISKLPLVFRSFNFGKYKGRKIKEILETDKGYLEWLLAQKLQNEGEDSDWIYTLKHYLGKNS